MEKFSVWKWISKVIGKAYWEEKLEEAYKETAIFEDKAACWLAKFEKEENLNKLLREKYEKSKEDVNCLREIIKNHSEKNEELSVNLENMRSIISEKVKKIQSQESETKTLREIIKLRDVCIERLHDEMKEKIEEVNCCKKDAQDANGRLRAERDDAKRKLFSQQGVSARYKKTVEKLKEEKKELEVQITELMA